MWKGLTLTVGIREPDQPVNVDDDRMVQVNSNLLSNETKFTPTGGRAEER
jgi:signal transduction histidine kinase